MLGGCTWLSIGNIQVGVVTWDSCLSHPCLTGLVYIGELIRLPVAWSAGCRSMPGGILALLGSAQVGAAVI